MSLYSSSSSSSSSSKEDKRSLEELNKENEALQKEINTLRTALGIDKKEEEEEKARLLAVFKKYDADNSGTIDRKEFDAVAFDAGYDPSGLDEKSVTKIFDEIKPAKSGQLTFPEFYKWFKASSGASTKSKNYQLGLAVRLQAKSWNKSIEGTRGALKSAKAKMGTKSESKAPKEIKSSFTETREGVRVKVQVGEFKDIGIGVAFQIRNDPEGLAELKTNVGVPEGKSAFAFIDFGVASGADEGQLGELAGILDGMLGMVGGGLNEKAGIPIYHSHTVRPCKDRNGENVLRAAIFADINPIDMAAAATGQSAELFSPHGLLDLRVALESPLSLLALRDPSFTLSTDKIKARFTIDGSISSTLEKRVTDATAIMPLPPGAGQAAGAFANFFKGLNIDLETIGIDELIAKFPPSERGIGHKLREGAEMASMTPPYGLLKAFNTNIMAQMEAMAGPEMGPIIKNALKNLTGPKRAQLQIESTEVSVTFTGFDVLALIQALAAE